jgi:hypothetical protein
MRTIAATWRILRADPALVVLLLFWRVIYPLLRMVWRGRG